MEAILKIGISMSRLITSPNHLFESLIDVHMILMMYIHTVILICILYLCFVGEAMGQESVYINEEVYLVKELVVLDVEDVPYARTVGSTQFIVRGANDFLDSICIRKSRLLFGAPDAHKVNIMMVAEKVNRHLRPEEWIRTPRYAVASPSWEIIDSVSSLGKEALAHAMKHNSFSMLGPLPFLEADTIEGLPGSAFVKQYLHSLDSVYFTKQVDTINPLSTESQYKVSVPSFPHYGNLSFHFSGTTSIPMPCKLEPGLYLQAFKIQAKGVLVGFKTLPITLLRKIGFGFMRTTCGTMGIATFDRADLNKYLYKADGKFWFFEAWDWNPPSNSYFGCD